MMDIMSEWAELGVQHVILIKNIFLINFEDIILFK